MVTIKSNFIFSLPEPERKWFLARPSIFIRTLLLSSIWTYQSMDVCVVIPLLCSNKTQNALMGIDPKNIKFGGDFFRLENVGIANELIVALLCRKKRVEI